MAKSTEYLPGTEYNFINSHTLCGGYCYSYFTNMETEIVNLFKITYLKVV